MVLAAHLQKQALIAQELKPSKANLITSKIRSRCHLHCRMVLAAHPQKQALIAQELKRFGLLASPENPEPRDVTADDLPKLLYIDAVCVIGLPAASTSACCTLSSCSTASRKAAGCIAAAARQGTVSRI